MGEPQHDPLSKYRLIRRLGAGGMGEVHLAHDTALNRDVAIKYIAPERLGDADARRRLIREAQAAAALDHPSICPVYEVSADHGAAAFIVMQDVAGETLAERLRRGPLDEREALTIALHIADALATAHGHGVLHRDLKPDNIVVTPSGLPKLLDFGIAHVACYDGTAETQTSLTGEGQIFGTPGFMAPERIERKITDGRSDLFSLGAVLFECLTGRPAFTGRSALEIHAAVLHVDPPRVSSVRPELTDRYDELCRRLLVKAPRDRFQTAEEVVAELRRLLTSTMTAAVATVEGPAVGPTRRRMWITAAVTMFLVAAAVGGWRWMTRGGEAITPAAARYFARGEELIRDGAYASARNALQEAVRLSPGYAPAYIRLADAHIELDEELDARDALLAVERSRLDANDRLRFDAVSALVTNKLDTTIRAYRALTERRQADADAWLNLGRAQALAGLPADARASYGRSLAVDAQYAAAHLRLGMLEADAGQRARALEEYDAAEKLYRASANVEGTTETLLRRGYALAAVNDIASARDALSRAASLAAGLESRSQEIRAQLALGTVILAEGQLTQAQEQTQRAVQLALDRRLDTVAANGLIDPAIAMTRRQRLEEAATLLRQALQLSQKSRGLRTALRARLQLASNALDRGAFADAVKSADEILPEFRNRGYDRWEITALNIAARAQEGLGEYARARERAQQALSKAESVKDDVQAGEALDNLAGESTALGLLPEALAYRRRLEAIHRRQQDRVRLAFDLQNTAELLIRLGRGNEADALLRELDEGAAAGLEPVRAAEAPGNPGPGSRCRR